MQLIQNNSLRSYCVCSARTPECKWKLFNIKPNIVVINYSNLAQYIIMNWAFKGFIKMNTKRNCFCENNQEFLPPNGNQMNKKRHHFVLIMKLVQAPKHRAIKVYFTALYGGKVDIKCNQKDCFLFLKFKTKELNTHPQSGDLFP